MPYLRATGEGVVIALHVQPRASRTGLNGLGAGELRVRLNAPPVDGAANEACRIYLAKLLGVPKSRVDLVAGEKSRHKQLLVRDGELASIRQRLALELERG